MYSKSRMSIILLMGCACLTAQTAPGGVSGYLHWQKHHAETPQELSLEALSKGISCFSVSRADTLKEQSLWSIGQADSDKLTVTTHRSANLVQGAFINYMRQGIPDLRMHTYMRRHSPSDTLLDNRKLRIGKHYSSALPVEPLSGTLREMIVYGRVLSYHERIRIESYLAIKHSISIDQTEPTSYLSSVGGVIWDAHTQRSYRHAIAGVGRDDKSGLLKLNSPEGTAGDLLGVHLPQQVGNGHFLVWGHNGAAALFGSQRGKAKRLKREWSMLPTGEGWQGLPIEVGFDTKQIGQIAPLAADERYWLAVDFPQGGLSTLEQRRYYPVSSTHNGIATFKGVSVQGPSPCQLTLLAMPDFFTEVEVGSPECGSDKKGRLTAVVLGGEAPFNITLASYGSSYTHAQTTTQRTIAFEDLEQGVYRLSAVDRNGKHYGQEFLVSNADMGQVPFFEPITLNEGSSLWVDALPHATAYDYTCVWVDPGGKEWHDSAIRLQQGGLYQLKVTDKEGCSTLRELEVHLQTAGNFRRIELLPNPTRDGNVEAMVELSEQAGVAVTVQDMGGRQIGTYHLQGESFYRLGLHLPQPGVWLVVFRSGNQVESYKIIRQ